MNNTAEQVKSPFNWPIVGGLLFLTGIPAIPGIFLIALVLMGPGAVEGVSESLNALHFETPMAVAVHGGAGFVFFLTMPFQFSTKLRMKRPNFHRISGRFAVSSGVLMSLSGIWMHLVLTPNELGPRFVTLVLMGVAITTAFSYAIYCAVQRKTAQHQVWMMRAVAIALAEVTPIFVDLVLYITLSQFDSLLTMAAQLKHDYGRLLAIVINLTIVELFRLKRD